MTASRFELFESCHLQTAKLPLIYMKYFIFLLFFFSKEYIKYALPLKCHFLINYRVRQSGCNLSNSVRDVVPALRRLCFCLLLSVSMQDNQKS